MAKKRGNLFEQYIDKLVLGLSVFVSLGLLWVFLLSQPYTVEYGAEKVGPGDLDRAITTNAQRLKSRLEEPPEPVPPYVPPNVTERFENPIQYAQVPSWELTQPGIREQALEEKRLYRLPDMPMLSNLEAVRIRTVAYVPTQPLDQNLPYDKAPVELGDVDLVTVQTSLDISTLYRSFEQSFDSPVVRPQWRDSDLARPVFGAVDLERRTMQDDGSWGSWERVRPPRTDYLAGLLDVPRDPSKMLDIELKKNQLKRFEYMRHVLQPDPYDFASPHEVWLTPSLHEEYVRLAQREQEQKLREQREQERERLEREREARSRTTTTTRTQPGRVDPGMRDATARGGRDRLRPGTDPRRGDSMMEDSYYYQEGMGGIRRPGQPPKKEETSQDILAKLADVMLKDNENLRNRQEPLLIWAHDDSITQAGVYQYRLRVGVFNPILGKEWVANNQADLNDRVFLFTQYTEPTEPITVEDREYFFPMQVVADARDTVEIKVARYHLGRWRTNDFTVRSGEPIGRELEVEPTLPLADAGRGMDPRAMAYYEGMGTGMPTGPEKIDFRTGAVLVDVQASATWETPGARLSRQEIQEILYAETGGDIERFAVSSRNWPGEVRSLHERIKQSEDRGPVKYVQRSHYRTQRQTAAQSRLQNQMDPYRGMDPRMMDRRF
ncbi:MAG: hypothetical protein JW828_10575 [Sedimentisphaerales bacterium]|nr:hypothetical protein [Sedimentisphaerales bacterium]